MNFCHPIAKSYYFQKLGESTLVFMTHSTYLLKVLFTIRIYFYTWNSYDEIAMFDSKI